MRAGNADMGAGITQTRGKRVDHAKDLARHHDDNVMDMWLRVGGGTIFLLTFLSLMMFLAGPWGWHFAFPTVGVAALMGFAYVFSKIRRNMRREKELEEFRKRSAGSRSSKQI